MEVQCLSLGLSLLGVGHELLSTHLKPAFDASSHNSQYCRFVLLSRLLS